MTISLARSVSSHLGGVRWHLARRSRVTRWDRSGSVGTAIEWPASQGLAQLKLGPANAIVSPIATRFPKAGANCYVTHVSADTKNHFHTGEEPTEARIAEPFADQRLLTPFLTFLSGIRTLVAGLILVALIPNLTLGAIFWFGVINTTPATHPSRESSVTAQFAIPSPVLSSPAMLEATAGGEVIFPIALDGTDGVPARSIIAVRGLPLGSRLSSGRPYDETEWNLKPDEIGDLHLVLPSSASGDAKLVIQLVATDGAILADAATVLKMSINSAANIPPSTPVADLAATQVSDERAQAITEKGAERGLANLDPAMAKGDAMPLPVRRPAKTSNDDANWIALTAVNLRERPTRSAPAIGVVEKGTKLHMIGRKRSWVQMTNPATSEKGWIYARHVATLR